MRLWKVELQKLADETGLVLHGHVVEHNCRDNCVKPWTGGAAIDTGGQAVTPRSKSHPREMPSLTSMTPGRMRYATMKLRNSVAQAACAAVLFPASLSTQADAAPSPPVLSNVSAGAGQLRFSIGGCLPTDGVQIQTSTNLKSGLWQIVNAFPAGTNPITFSTNIPAKGEPIFFRVAVDHSLGLPLTTRGHGLYDALGNKVYLRGLGRANGTDSPVGDWYGPGGHYWDGAQWDYDFAHLAERMDATLQAMRVTYKCNFIREFLPVNWWWEDNIDTSKYQYFPKATTSYRYYEELLVQRALLQGMYVDFCPYSFRSYPDVFWWWRRRRPMRYRRCCRV